MQAESVFMSKNVFTGTSDEALPLAICVRVGLFAPWYRRARQSHSSAPSTHVEDFGDAFLCAGFHDAHVHAFHSALYSSPLAEMFLGESEADCVARLAPLAKRKPHGWLFGAKGGASTDGTRPCCQAKPRLTPPSPAAPSPCIPAMPIPCG